MLMDVDIMALEKFLNTMLIFECGIAAVVGIAHNRWLVTHDEKRHQLSPYLRIVANAPHMKRFLDMNRFVFYFVSVMILCGVAYFIFIEPMRFGFAACGVVAIAEILVVSRVLVVEKGYLSFIEQVMLEESIKEFETNKRIKEGTAGKNDEKDL